MLKRLLQRNRRDTCPKPAEQGADLADVHEVWESWAQADPLWAVHSLPDKQGRAWDLDAFLATGRTEVDRWMVQARDVGLRYPRFGRVMDFGCGVGRLSQALSRYTRIVVGVDVSETMIGIARRINRKPRRISFVQNMRGDLSLFPDGHFDGVLAHVVLQHMPPSLAKAYIREFFRVTRPGGFILFQLPSHLRDDGDASPEADASPETGAADEPLPEDACKVAVEVSEIPAKAPASHMRLAVRVTNASTRTWRQSPTYPLNLGNHWRDGDGALIVANDGRTLLPRELAPGESADLDLDVRTPETAGRYLLDIDVVQEGVRWFADVAGTCASREVEITELADSSAHAGSTRAFGDLVAPAYFRPRPFDMHGVPYEEVSALIRELGGELRRAEPHYTEWVDYMYFIRR